MPINNTTQNKEELSEEVEEMIVLHRIPTLGNNDIPTENYIVHIQEGLVRKVISKSLSQAHQSGIEEGVEAERKRITRGIKMIPYEQMPDQIMRMYLLALADPKSLKENKQFEPYIKQANKIISKYNKLSEHEKFEQLTKQLKKNLINQSKEKNHETSF